MLKNRSVLRLAVVAMVLSFTSALHAQLSFLTDFTGATTQQQTATTEALNRLAGYFSNNLALRVAVTVEDLSADGTLGSSSAGFQIHNSLYYATPLYNALTSTDTVGATTSITISMNLDSRVTWGYGTGAPGATTYSWQTVIVHEVLHSMGFFDGINTSAGDLANGGYTIFDSFVQTSGGTSFTSYTTDLERQAAIISNDLYWTGAYGVAANGGQNVKLYAPNPYESGSTYSHIDPSLTGVGGVLFPTLDANVYFAGPTAVELGIMRDMGWSLTAVPEPSTYALIFGLGVFGVVFVRRRRS